MYTTLDIMGNGIFKKNVITVKSDSISKLNQWIMLYVNDGYMIQLRNVDKPEPVSVVELE